MPVETGRWQNIELDDRKCTICDKNTLGDEFHYLMECHFFKRDRERLLPREYHKRPNILKYRKLLTSCDERSLHKLALFMGIIIKHFQSTN